MDGSSGTLSAARAVATKAASSASALWDAAAAGAEDTSCLTQRTGNFAGVQVSAGGSGNCFVSAVWDTATGDVVSLNLSGDLPAADPAAVLDAWRQDLGLDVLGDWQDESTETGVSSWSDKAQVYLYCAAEENSLRLTMTNLSGMERG